MSWLSKLTGVNIRLSALVPGASASAIRKAIEGLKLDAPTLRILASVCKDLAHEKADQQ
jgi:hypothetical protein